MKKNFNHISDKIDQNKISQLMKIYDNYYEKYQTCHKKYKKLNKIKVSLQSTGIVLTAVGAGTSVVNPLTLIITGVGALISAWVSKSNIVKKVEQTKFVCVLLQKVWNRIVTILRTGNYTESDEIKLLSDLKVIDDIISVMTG